MAKITVLFWRDIPAQIVVKIGERRSKKQKKVELSRRFFIAIDEAAMKSGKTGSEDYLSEWRKVDYGECGNDLENEIKLLLQKLESEYTNKKLKKLISNAGFEN